MKKLIFKPYDFGLEEVGNTNQTQNIEACARIAQSLFDAWYKENIEGAPKVFGILNQSVWSPTYVEAPEKDTHTARLVCIEEIK